MKKKHTTSLLLARSAYRVFGFITSSFLTIALHNAHAQDTWDGGGTDNNWSTAANWLDDSAPVGTGALTFTGTTQITVNNDYAENTVFNGLTFANGGTGTESAFTLNGNAITLGGNIFVAGYSATASTYAPDVINLNLVLNADRDIATNGGSAVTLLTINGNISQDGTTARSLSKSGSGTSGNLTLTGNNTYTGNTIINNGTIFVTKIADSGDSNLGYGNLRISGGTQGGTLDYRGAGSTTARTLQVGNGNAANHTSTSTIVNNATNGGTGLKFTAANFTTADTVAIAASRTLAIGGSNTDDNTISGIIGDVSTTTRLNLSKTGAGRWILGGDNSYTGTTSLANTGHLAISHANALGGTSNGTTIAGAGGGNGQLRLEGGESGISFAAEPLTVGTSTSNIAVLLNVSGNNTWNGTITATGGTASNHLNRIQADLGTKLTIAGNMVGIGAATGNSFVLQGAGDIEVTGVISGGTAQAITSGSSGGDTGVRTLSNANTYGGVTNITGGVLVLNHANAVPGGIGATGGTSNINIGSSGTPASILGLANGDLLRAIGTGVDQIRLTAKTSGFAAYGADRIVNLSGTASTVTMNYGTNFLTTGAGTNSTFVLGSATSTHTLDFQNPINMGANARIFHTNDGTSTTNVDGKLSGLISGTASFTKTGTGTLELSSTSNTYIGGTNVNEGRLLVSGVTANTGGVVVASGATLGGSGTVGAAITVNGSIAPGNSSGIGTLKASQGVTWTGGVSAWAFELGASNAADKLAITGAFNKGTGSTFSFDFMGSDVNGTFDLVSWTTSTTFNTSSPEFTYSNLGGGRTGTFSVTGNTLQFTAVPEASNLLIGGLIGLGLMARRRKQS